MNLHSTYRLLVDGHIDTATAADRFGMTETALKISLAKTGPKRAERIFKVMDQIAAGEISRDEAAAKLNVTVRRINSMMLTWKVERPLANAPFVQERADLKWKLRKEMAIRFIAGDVEIFEAAEKAGTSDRQMYRWVSQLLHKHLAMPTRALGELNSLQRRRVAAEVDTAEGIEAAEKLRLREIIEGRRTLEDEAVDRAWLRRERRRGVHAARG